MALRVIGRVALVATIASLAAANPRLAVPGLLALDDQQARADGQLVARVVDSDDRTEVVSLAALRGPVDAAAFLQVAREPRGFGRGEDSLGEARLSMPPRSADFDDLHLDERDVDALSKCRIGDCRVRLTAPAIRRFEGLDWAAPDRTARAEAVFREILAEEAALYVAHGHAGLSDYADGRNAPRRGEGLNELLSRPFHRADNPRELRAHLGTFPSAGAALMDEFLAWRKDRFWKKSVIGLFHVAIWREAEPAGDRLMVATKQFYASHYYESAVEVIELQRTEREADADLTFVGRARAEIRPSGFTWLERILLRRLVRGRLASQFESVRTRLVALK